MYLAFRRLAALAVLCSIFLLAAAAPARADWDDGPGFGFTGDNLLSSPSAPCGTGTLPRGHFPPEVPVLLPFQGVSLVVRQDPNRLCYVYGRIAEAPTIRVRQGEDLYVTLLNEITDPSALDKLIAPGHLDDANPRIAAKPGFYRVEPAMHHRATGETNLHLHGLPLPPVVPQDETLKTCVDPAPGPRTGPAACGHRQFAYHYHIPPGTPAGLYWYHPHIHGEVQAQMLMGLSGALVVEGPEDDARRAAGIDDRIFVFRQSTDLDAKAAGMPVPGPASQGAAAAAATAQGTPAQGAAPQGIVPGPLIGTAPLVPIPIEPPAYAPPSLDPAAQPARAKEARALGGTIDTADEMTCSDNAGIDELTMNGAMVQDGQVADTDLAHLEIGTGKRQLWRILNAATDAFLDLQLVDENGEALPVELVARDGTPLMDDDGKPLPPQATSKPQLVPPAGRLEFLVTAPAPGRKAYLMSRAVNTGCAGDKVPERTLAYLTATDGTPANPPTIAQTRTTDWISAPDALPPAATPLFAGLLARKTDKIRTIAFAEYPHPGADDLNDFYIFERKPDAVARPFEMGGPPAITVNAGTTEEWTIENWTNELHAFHIHQVHFRVLALNGAPVADPPLLDVVTVPAARTDAGDVAKATGPVVPGRVRIKLYFPPELAGDIPFHCHLVDHEDSGMMAILRVLPPRSSTQALLRKAELDPADILTHPPICRAPDGAAPSP